MKTRCPYPDCSHQWDFDESSSQDFRSSNGFYRGRCVKCERHATLKPIEIWEQLERKILYLGGKGALRGGSEIEDPGEKSVNAQPSLDLGHMHVILEDIRSLHNVGSIFRTSDAFGFGHLHLCGITGTPDRKDVKKTSLSAEGHLEWQYHISGMQAVTALREVDATIISLERCDGSVDISELSLERFSTKPLCLVLGNEVSGVSEEIRHASTLICHIPMRGMKESLNVSVAFGVAAYTISNLMQKALPV